MRIAIDTAIILYQGNTVLQQRYRHHFKILRNVGIALLFYRALQFMEAGIDPIFILEGVTLPQDRKVKRDLMQLYRQMMELMGVPTVWAAGEGDATGAYVVIKGDAEAFATPNIADAFFFGCPTCLKSNLHATLLKDPRIRLTDWLANLGFTTIDQYRDYFILVGSDYNDKLLPTGMGKKMAQDLIRKYGCIENITEIEIDMDIVNTVRHMGKEPSVTQEYAIQFTAPRIDTLKKFLTRYKFSEGRINAGIGRLESLWRKKKCPK